MALLFCSYLHLQPGKVAEAAKDEKDSDEEGQDGTLQFLWKLNTESADPDANIVRPYANLSNLTQS